VDGADEVVMPVVPVHAPQHSCLAGDDVPLDELDTVEPGRANELEQRPAGIALWVEAHEKRPFDRG
jgi:hypothetical protein